MQGFLKTVALVAIIGIVIIASLFVLDMVTSVEARDMLQKVLLVLGLVALGGIAITALTRKNVQ